MFANYLQELYVNVLKTRPALVFATASRAVLQRCFAFSLEEGVL